MLVSLHKEKLRFRLLTVLALVISMIAVATMHVSPLQGEDYALTRTFMDEGFFERLQWIVNRSRIQIGGWNARVGEQLAIFWLSMPAWVGTLGAALTWSGLAWLAPSIVRTETPSRSLFIVAVLLIFPLWPLYELFFWRTVQAGYLQPLLVHLFLIRMYRDRQSQQTVVHSVWWPLALGLCGLIAGASFENVPPITALYLFGALWIHRGWHIKTLIPVVTILVGWLWLVFHPSTLFRRNFYLEQRGSPDVTSFGYWLERLDSTAGVLWTTSWPLLIAGSVAFIFLAVRYKESRATLMLLGVCVAGVLASVVAAPYTEARAFAMGWAVLFGMAVHGVTLFLRRSGWPMFAGSAVLSAVSIVLASQAFAAYRDYSEKVGMRLAQIEAARMKGACRQNVVVQTIKTDETRRVLNNREGWHKASSSQMSSYHRCRVLYVDEPKEAE